MGRVIKRKALSLLDTRNMDKAYRGNLAHSLVTRPLVWPHMGAVTEYGI
jgi:hypothetical protein